MNSPDLHRTTEPSRPPTDHGGMTIHTGDHQALPFPGVGESLLPLGDGRHLLLSQPEPATHEHDAND